MSVSLQDLVDAHPDCETFRFGVDAASCAAILDLVRSGRKTATCEAARVYGASGDAWPQVGRRDIALNWDGTPALMVETTSVETRCFEEMDAQFVETQGEFRDLAEWRETYRAYFDQTGGWSADMKLMCERFKMVEDYR